MSNMPWRVGDVVMLMNVGESWGKFALITRIWITECGTGQIYMLANGLMSTIPFASHEKHIAGVVSDR